MTTAAANPLFRPLLDTAAEYRREWGTIEASIEELLDDNELLQVKLEEKTLALNEVEHQLAEQRAENQRLLDRLEKQDARLTEALAEMKRLSGEQSQLQQALLMAAESSLAISEEVRDSGSVAASNAVSAEVQTELKELRRLLEDQARHWQELAQLTPAGPPPSQSQPQPVPPPPRSTLVNHNNTHEEPAASNAAVSSVMAQFAKLQKDVASRKKKK